jgi:hypothetical protein
MRTPALLLTILLLVPAAGETAAAAGVSRLIVTPGQAHPGGWVFLSGTGFPPGRRLTIATTCGRALSRSRGPLPNRFGRFSAFALRLSFPAPGPCAVTASAAGDTATTHALSLIPAGRALARCAADICLSVQAFLIRLRRGASGRIVISGWPGAAADVTVARVERGATYRHVRLNWRGVASVKTWVAPGLLKGIQARIFVRARLGRVTGQTSAPFHVMLGGR